MTDAHFNYRQTGLPLESELPRVAELLQKDHLVLIAEPGAGKSSLAPFAMAEACAGRIVLLQPRRLAAQVTANRLADLLGERVGQRIGLTMRGTHTVGHECRIEVVTEAVLTQRLHRDPELPGIGGVILDEFHERNLHADLGLAMLLEVQESIRPDLRIMVMSATIDPDPICTLMGGAPVLQVPGRSFPIDTRYLTRPPRPRFADAMADAISRALDEGSGDVLAFVPGRGEIQRVTRSLVSSGVESRFGVEILTLAGGGSGGDLFHQTGPRRVVVATAVAETSLTVPGIEAVVDGGLMRVPAFDAATGFGALNTNHVTTFSADQRRGRAGRLGPGRCYRLWSKEDHRHLEPSAPPEIAVGEPAQIAFELCRWGDPEGTALPLLSPPPAHRLRAGRSILEQLGLITAAGELTKMGRQANVLPTSPHIAAMLLAAEDFELDSAIRLAAFLDDRTSELTSSDVQTAMDNASGRDLRRQEDRIRGAVMRVRSSPDPGPPDARRHEIDLGPFLARVWPDRVGLQRKDRSGAFQLAGGGEVQMLDRDPNLQSEFAIVVDAGGLTEPLRVRLAAPISRAGLMAVSDDVVMWHTDVSWDDRRGDVVSTRQKRFGRLILHSEIGPKPERHDYLDALASAVGRRSLEVLNWSDEASEVLVRLRWLHSEDPAGWPALSDGDLAQRIPEWFAGDSVSDPIRSRDLLALLPWDRAAEVAVLAPQHLETPTGRSKQVSYETGRPVWAVRIQDVLGLDTHPTIGPHSTPVTVELLSPANRPAQVTTDLPSFWRGSYAAVRSELRGRYPKHQWPEDPLVPPKR